MHRRIGAANIIYTDPEWIICKNYSSFVQTIEDKGIPIFVSFDHDLADEHIMIGIEQELMWGDYYRKSNREATGYDCAKWLTEYCYLKNVKFPEWAVHSMNPVGTENITKYLKNLGL